MKTTLFDWSPYLAQISQKFIVSPLIRLSDKPDYEEIVHELRQNGKISINEVYLKSPDSRFRNLLNPRVLLSDFLSIFSVIKRSKPDVIVCFYVLHAYPLVILKKIFKFSLCVVATGSDVNLDNSPVQKMAKKIIYHNCDIIFAVSRRLKDRIEKECRSKVEVIPFSADPSFFKPFDSRTVFRMKWGIGERSKVVLTVCRLDRYKGVDILIRAFGKLNLSNVNLLIAGEGKERRALEELSCALGIQENVSFLGFVGRKDLLELYNLADIFALASYSEGLPKALMESMSCGCIPIVTCVGDVEAVVADGFNGFVVETGDYEKFAVMLRDALSLSEEKTKLMRERARKIVVDNFDGRKLVKRLVKSIEAFSCRE